MDRVLVLLSFLRESDDRGVVRSKAAWLVGYVPWVRHACMSIQILCRLRTRLYVAAADNLQFERHNYLLPQNLML